MMTMKKGDLLPDLVITVTGVGGAVVNLTTATTITVIGEMEGAAVPLFQRAATGNASGVVTMAWQPGDTATAGRLNISVKVVWPGTKPQHFPASSFLSVDIEDTLE